MTKEQRAGGAAVGGLIPEDVRWTAIHLINDMAVNPTMSLEERSETVARAILAERQRCADVVRMVKTDVGVYVRRSDVLDAILTPT